MLTPHCCSAWWCESRDAGTHIWTLSAVLGALHAADVFSRCVPPVFLRSLCSCVALLLVEATAAATTLELPVSLVGRVFLAWESWQGRGRDKFLYTLELSTDVAMHVLMLLHHVHVWVLHGLSFHLLDALLLLDTRAVVLSILQRLRTHKVHSAAASNIEAAFPDAPEAMLESEQLECVICRDQLASAKQLPCGHVFHVNCLGAWLQQSGSQSFTCPMCRTPLPLPSKAAVCSVWLPAQQQQLLLQQPGYRAASGPVGPSIIGSLSFSLSLDEPPAAAAGQLSHHVQLQDRAELWETDLLQALESPGSDAGLDALLLAEAITASMQAMSRPSSPDRGSSWQDRTSELQASSSGSSSPSAALLADAVVQNYRSSASSNSGATHCRSSSSEACAATAGRMCSLESCARRGNQGAGGRVTQQELHEAMFSAAAAAVAAGALEGAGPPVSPFSGAAMQPEHSTGSTLGGAGSSSYMLLEEDGHHEAAERFYSQKYGDPLAGE